MNLNPLLFLVTDYSMPERIEAHQQAINKLVVALETKGIPVKRVYSCTAFTEDENIQIDVESLNLLIAVLTDESTSSANSKN